MSKFGNFKKKFPQAIEAAKIIFKDAYSFFFSNLREFSRFSLFFIPLTILITLGLDTLEANDWWFWGVWAIFDAWFAFLWHRLVLLSQENQSLFGIKQEGFFTYKKEGAILLVKFIAASLLFFFVWSGLLYLPHIFFIDGNSFSLPGDWSFFWFLIPVFFIFMVYGPYLLLISFVIKFLPAFPALATQQRKLTFKWLWKLNIGKGLHMFFSFLFVLAPLFAIQWGATYVFEDLLGVPFEKTKSVLDYSPIEWLDQLFWFFYSMVFLALGVTANSEIYRQLTGFKNPNRLA